MKNIIYNVIVNFLSGESSFLINEFIEKLLNKPKQIIREEQKKIKTFRENQDRETQKYLENKKRLQDKFSLLISEANKEGKSTIDFLIGRGLSYKEAKTISRMAKQHGLRADADRTWIQNIRGKILNGYTIVMKNIIYNVIVSVLSGIGIFFIVAGVGQRSGRNESALWQFEPIPIGIGAVFIVGAVLLYKNMKSKSK